RRSATDMPGSQGALRSTRLATAGPVRAAGTASVAGGGGGGPPVRYAEIRFCQAVRYFWLLSALESKILTFESVSLGGKMSGLFATEGSYFFAHSPAPATGGM